MAAGKHEVRKITFLAHVFIKEKEQKDDISCFFEIKDINALTMQCRSELGDIAKKKNLIFFNPLIMKL